jgi:hypothetical protein
MGIRFEYAQKKGMAEMTFLPGCPPGPGRPKGLRTRNAAVRLTVTEQLEALGFDTIRAAVELFNDSNCPPKVKGDLIKLFATYQFTKAESRATIEHRSLAVRVNMTSPQVEDATVEATVIPTVEGTVVTDD